MSNFNTNGKFDVDKWVRFMNTSIDNIDETVSTKLLDDTLIYSNKLVLINCIFDNGWKPIGSLDHLKTIKNSKKVLVKCEPKQYVKVVRTVHESKQALFLLKKFTKFLIYYPETKEVRELEMSEYADLGQKKYIIKGG